MISGSQTPRVVPECHPHCSWGTERLSNFPRVPSWLATEPDRTVSLVTSCGLSLDQLSLSQILENLQTKMKAPSLHLSTDLPSSSSQSPSGPHLPLPPPVIHFLMSWAAVASPGVPPANLLCSGVRGRYRGPQGYPSADRSRKTTLDYPGRPLASTGPLEIRAF